MSKSLSDSIEQLKNLGPKSAQMLSRVGINTIDELAKRGAVEAYLEVKLSGQSVSLNLLHAIYAGLQDRHWTELAQDEKQQLALELDEQEQIRQLFGVNLNHSK